MDRSRNLIIILIVIILILIIALVGAMVYIFMNQDNNSNNETVVDNSASSGVSDYINAVSNMIDKVDDATGSYDDVLEDRNEAVNNMALQIFNSQFEVYEGTNVSAAKVKSLISTVEASNISNTEHTVTLNNEGITTKEQVDTTKTYTVELAYDDDGYVNEISITETSGDEEENPEEPEQPETPVPGNGDMDKLIFNTAFMSYVGNINGDRLNSLLQVIQDSNTKNPEHQVTLSSNNLSDLNGIASTNIYTITLSYGDDGYISNINIDIKL